MTEDEASAELGDLLVGLGVQHGEVIYLSLDMAKLPLPRWPVPLTREAFRDRENRWCDFLLRRVMAALGPEGTVLVGSFTYACGNPAIPFVAEETPSEIGPFTNWLRTRPGAIRSLHPMFSVAGLGHHARAILDNTGGAGFGPSSPFGRLSAMGARFVNLGIPFRKSLTYVHHLEQCHGCNHRYHKVFGGRVISQGRVVERQFLGYMRWRGVDAAVDVGPLENELKRTGQLIEIDRPGLFGQSARAADIDRVGYDMLARDAWAFSTRKIRIDLDDSIVASKLQANPIVTFRLGH